MIEAVNKVDTRDAAAFSVLAWLEALGMFVAVIWLFCTSLLWPHDAEFVRDEGRRG